MTTPALHRLMLELQAGCLWALSALAVLRPVALLWAAEPEEFGLLCPLPGSWTTLDGDIRAPFTVPETSLHQTFPRVLWLASIPVTFHISKAYIYRCMYVSCTWGFNLSIVHSGPSHFTKMVNWEREFQGTISAVPPRRNYWKLPVLN